MASQSVSHCVTIPAERGEVRSWISISHACGDAVQVMDFDVSLRQNFPESYIEVESAGTAILAMDLDGCLPKFRAPHDRVVGFRLAPSFWRGKQIGDALGGCWVGCAGATPTRWFICRCGRRLLLRGNRFMPIFFDDRV